MRTQLQKVAVGVVTLLAAASVWSPSGHATRVLEKDLKQLTGESATIAIGTVVGVSSSRWSIRRCTEMDPRSRVRNIGGYGADKMHPD